MDVTACMSFISTSLRVLGRLWSVQGPPSIMPHGMVERPHDVEFSLSLFSFTPFISTSEMSHELELVSTVCKRCVPLQHR